MKEVIPGIYLLKLPMDNFPPGHINSYLLRDKNSYILIDTGWDTENALRSLNEQLREIGADIQGISKILLTHSHTDHAGMAGRLRKLSGAIIYMHKLEQEVVKSRFLSSSEPGQNHFFEATNNLLKMHGAPETDLVRPKTVPPKVSSPPMADITLKGGETISFGGSNLQVLLTPGHSPGHLSFYEMENKILFSGDLVLPETISNVGLHLHQSANPLDAYLDSLKVISELDVRRVLPAHEGIFTDLPGRIEQITEHHMRKSTEIMQVIADKRPRTAFEISYTMSIYPDTLLSGWDKLSLWDKRFVLLETIAHLESLTVRGMIEKFLNNGAISYRFAG